MPPALAACIMPFPRNSFFTNVYKSVFVNAVFLPHASLSFLPRLLTCCVAGVPANHSLRMVRAQTPFVCNTQASRSYVKSNSRYGALYGSVLIA